MIDKINMIITKDFEEIANSPLSLVLLDCYSKLYLNGAQPRFCRASQLSYYNEILKTGRKMAEKFEATNKRTFVLKHKTGLLYAGKPFYKHFNLETMNDADATSLLDAGLMNAEMFEILPENKSEGILIHKDEIIQNKPKKQGKKSKS